MNRVNQTDPQNHPPSHVAMEHRSTYPERCRPFVVQAKNRAEDESRQDRSFSEKPQQHVKTSSNGYFSIESMLVLVGLTASLLILPLMLPTLPPPPLLLLVLPIGILGLLLVIAFMPSNVRDLRYM